MSGPFSAVRYPGGGWTIQHIDPETGAIKSCRAAYYCSADGPEGRELAEQQALRANVLAAMMAEGLQPSYEELEAAIALATNPQTTGEG